MLIKFQIFKLTFFLILFKACSFQNFKIKKSLNQKEVQDPCYDSITGKAQRCMPKFENVAFNKLVQSTSTCGSPALNYCIQQYEWRSFINSKSLVKYCDRCDAAIPNSVRDTKYLTDSEELNLTCWVSSLINDSNNFNISLTISFGKKYELTYISLHFCNHLKADSLVIMKSMDYGKTWIPFQYYSSDCKKFYNKQLKAKITQSNEQEALCTNTHLDNTTDHLQMNNRIGFSTLEGRPSFNEFDTSPVLQDWITATDVKIIFNRLQKRFDIENVNSNYLALSELAIGGRCKCNGHASKCIMHKDGKLRCQCRHNTGGTECERCLPFHYDRPWARSTIKDPNECVACNCNSHSNKCRFNKELYLLSGRKSGGVCIDCKHNTIGRHCQLCREGFYRNSKYPISHRKACKECDCHLIGSVSRICNQTTGHCKCKEGVTGPRCDRCLKGYKQTNHASSPCKKITESSNENEIPRSKHSNSRKDTEGSNNVKQIKNCIRKLNIEKQICQNENILSVKVVEKIDGRQASDLATTNSKPIEYLGVIERVFKNSYSPLKSQNSFRNNIISVNYDYRNFETTLIHIRFHKHNYCKIPQLLINSRYLIFFNTSSILKTSNSKKRLTNNDSVNNPFYKNRNNLFHYETQNYQQFTKNNISSLSIDSKTILIGWKLDTVKKIKTLLNTDACREF